MIKRPAWILLVLLILVVGAYFLINSQPSKGNKLSPTAAGYSFLITQTDGILQSLRIFDDKNNAFKMQRDLSQTWVITAPTSGVADQGLASAAETQVGALRIVAMLQTPPALGAIGLDIPAYTLELGFAGGAMHKLEVGILTPTSSGYYVRYDDKGIYIISQSGIDALVNMLTAPPYTATTTPTPTADATGTATPVIASPTP